MEPSNCNTRRCPVVDDNYIPCTNVMTPEEERVDGMCGRCANKMWKWYQSDEDTPFLFGKASKR